MKSPLCRFSVPIMSSTCVSFPMFLNPNHDWNTSRSSKIIGFTKFSNDQSSSRLFWIGVPVRSNRETVLYCLSSFTSRQFLFLIRCPSSTIRNCHAYDSRKGLSMMQISKLVMTTENPSCCLASLERDRNIVLLICSRSALLPWYSTHGQEGSHFSNSFTQLGSVARGAAMRNGPWTVILKYSCLLN